VYCAAFCATSLGQFDTVDSAVSPSPTEQLLAAAKELGFEVCSITSAQPPAYFDAFERWLQNGMNAGMKHFVRNFEARKHPEALLPDVRSILMLGVSYAKVLNSEPHPIRQLSGIVEYARGVDYHRWIRHRLDVLVEKHRELFPDGRCRGTVDTAPILEKEYAVAAGLGTIGKNTLLIHPQFGSKLFLAAFLSTEWLERSERSDGLFREPPSRHFAAQDIPSPLAGNHSLPVEGGWFFDPCKECRRCLDVCPMGALVEPFVLDARRCLSYWTLIHRGELPEEVSEKRGNRFLGCDTCQSVCPHNQAIPVIPEGTLDPFFLDGNELRYYLAGSPLERIIVTVGLDTHRR